MKKILFLILFVVCAVFFYNKLLADTVGPFIKECMEGIDFFGMSSSIE